MEIFQKLLSFGGNLGMSVSDAFENPPQPGYEEKKITILCQNRACKFLRDCGVEQVQRGSKKTGSVCKGDI